MQKILRCDMTSAILYNYLIVGANKYVLSISIHVSILFE